MEINSSTRLEDILKEYPWLPDELVKLDSRLKVIKTPIGKMMIKNATVEDAVKKTGLSQETLVDGLNKMIKEREQGS